MDLKTIRSSSSRVDSDARREAASRARAEAMKARARAEAEGGEMKHRLGHSMFELMGEYFPEEMAARRRAHMARGFVAGVAVGLAARTALRLRR